MHKALICLTLSMTPLVSAHASEVPRYNPEAYCRQVASFSGGSSMIYNGCIEMEQKSYNNLKRIWPSVPSNTRNHCNEVASISGGTYAILEGCIDMESEAASSTKSFQF